MVAPLNHVYVSMINAFRADCANLIKKFKETNSDDFRDFSATWKAFKFNLIYEKYSHHGVHHDFKQDTLQIAKFIMLKDDFLGGFFLLYALYYVQDDPKASIRIELEEFEKLQTLIRQDRKTLLLTCQPGYLFGKLLQNDAFSFVKFARDFSMEGQNRARLIFNDPPGINRDPEEIDKKHWLGELLYETDIVDDLKKLDEKYGVATCKIKKDHPELHLSLPLMPQDFTNGLLNHIMNEESQPGSPTPSASSSIGTKRKKLKNKSFKTQHGYSKVNISTSITHRKVKQEVKPSTARKCKSKGAPKGKRKLYFKTMVNDPESEDDESYETDEDDPKFSLPDL